MILLKDLFSMLATGEFANLSLRKNETGAIDEIDYEKVINNLNLALVEIYKRFELMENEIRLHANTAVFTYDLTPFRIASLDNISTRDYLERPDNFDGNLNIIRIKAIYDEDGEEVKFNNRFGTPYIKQLTPTSLKITGLEENEVYNIVYQAHPSLIVLDQDFNLENDAIDAPSYVTEALLYYVASRTFKSVATQQQTPAGSKSDIYQQNYELACQKLEMYGLNIQNNDEDDDRFLKEGWA